MNEYESYGDPRLKALLERIWEVHCRKARDYVPLASPDSNLRASEKLGVPAWVGVLLRMNDKMTRLNEFARTRHLANEGVEDTLLDLANYALLDLILFQETRNGPTSQVHRQAGDATPGGNGRPVVQQPDRSPDAGRLPVPADVLQPSPSGGNGPDRPEDPGRAAGADTDRRGGFDGNTPWVNTEDGGKAVKTRSVGPPNSGDKG